MYWKTHFVYRFSYDWSLFLCIASGKFSRPRSGEKPLANSMITRVNHYNDVIMGTRRLKSPASSLFTQPFIRAQIKENIKAPRHRPLCGEFTGGRWIPRAGEIPAQMASNAKNASIWWRHHEQVPMCYRHTSEHLHYKSTHQSSLSEEST